MLPFLALILGNPSTHFPELIRTLTKETPVDFLFIDANETEENTYRYTTSESLSQEVQIIIDDYSSLLLIGKGTAEIFQSRCADIFQKKNINFSLVDPDLKTLRCQKENNLDLLRYFFIKGYSVFINNNLQKFKGLTLAEFTLLTELICLKNEDQFDEMLQREALFCFPGKPPALDAYPFIKPQETPHTEGFIEVLESPQQNVSMHTAPVFTLIKPTLHLWVYTKPFATSGSLDYDLQKLLKESRHRREEVKYCSFTPEAHLSDHLFSFMDNFEPDNELELEFNLDTIKQEIETYAKTKGLQILGERSSKTSRIILLKAE